MKWVVIVAILIFVDVASGILKSVYNGDFCSTGLRQGGLRKIAEIISVFLGWGMEFAQLKFGIETPLPTCATISSYLIIMELISILENLGAVDKRLGSIFSSVLGKLKEKSDDED